MFVSNKVENQVFGQETSLTLDPYLPWHVGVVGGWLPTQRASGHRDSSGERLRTISWGRSMSRSLQHPACHESRVVAITQSTRHRQAPTARQRMHVHTRHFAHHRAVHAAFPMLTQSQTFRRWKIDFWDSIGSALLLVTLWMLNPRRHHSRGRLVVLVACAVEVTAAWFKIFCFSQQRRGSWHFSRHSHKAGVCQGDAKQPAGHASDSGQRACLSPGRAGNVQALGSVSAPPYDAVFPGRHSSRCVRPMRRYWLPCPG